MPFFLLAFFRNWWIIIQLNYEIIQSSCYYSWRTRAHLIDLLYLWSLFWSAHNSWSAAGRHVLRPNVFSEIIIECIVALGHDLIYLLISVWMSMKANFPRWKSTIYVHGSREPDTFNIVENRSERVCFIYQVRYLMKP